MTRVLLRTDGGASIGLGHLHRSLSLAQALQREGAACFFAVYGDDEAAEKARATGFPASSLADAGDADEAARIAASMSCDVAIVDSYLTPAAYLSSLRATGLFVVAIDDLNAEPFAAQMVVSMGPHAPDAGYRSSSGDTRFLLGPRYTILRPEYWDSPLPVVKPVARNLLVTTGGADPDGLMPSWLRLVDDIDLDFSVTAIVGPFFRNRDEVHDTAASCSRVVRVVDSPAVTRPLIAAADVAFTAGGQTIFEAAALGVPAVAVEIADNQRPQLDGFDKLGAMRVAGRWGDDGVADAAAAMLARLLADADERRALSEAARSVVDRRGALAVAREIVAASAAR